MPAGITLRPPAAQGDLQSVVLSGANVIGLVDGSFETVAATWHKEILFALSKGVSVLGAASMGALRAAECRAFGMIAIGRIAERYVSGDLDDDAAVAQLHGPGELGYLPLTEALVDCGETIGFLHRAGALAGAEASQLLSAAQALFFKARTWRAVVDASGLTGQRAEDVVALLRQRRERLKQRDALLLVDAMAALPDERRQPPMEWRVSQVPSWMRTLPHP